MPRGLHCGRAKRSPAAGSEDPASHIPNNPDLPCNDVLYRLEAGATDGERPRPCSGCGHDRRPRAVGSGGQIVATVVVPPTSAVAKVAGDLDIAIGRPHRAGEPEGADGRDSTWNRDREARVGRTH